MEQRRGAIIILGMLLSDDEAEELKEKMGLMIKIGFGSCGKVLNSCIVATKHRMIFNWQSIHA